MEILTEPNPVLRQVAQPVKRVDAVFKRLVADMWETLKAANGLGLAAPQVGQSLRVFITCVDDEERVFINPVLSRHKGSCELEEGCLSLPGEYGVVRRPESVRITAYDLNGNEVVLDTSGLLARCIQHEYDHLDGVLFIDKTSKIVCRTE